MESQDDWHRMLQITPQDNPVCPNNQLPCDLNSTIQLQVMELSVLNKQRTHVYELHIKTNPSRNSLLPP